MIWHGHGSHLLVDHSLHHDMATSPTDFKEPVPLENGANFLTR
jgi:hypothetical protein